MNKERLVVIGNGMAGARTVEEILRRAPDKFAITMIGDEPRGNYNRILLSDVLNGAQHADDITLNSPHWYQSHGIMLHAGVRANRIRRESREVHCSNGLAVPYDKLIIATGSNPLIPAIDGLRFEDGSRKPGVFVMRTLDDCAAIAGYAVKCRSAVVVGGGLLGLEAARGLMRYGAAVTVVHRSGFLMNQQLDTDGAAMLKGTIEKLGIRVRLHKDTVALEGEDRVTGIRFADGETMPVDMVVFACGIVPNVQLGRTCGLQTERGICVDDRMRSVDDENIFVVGECAQHRGVTYGLVAPLWEQGRVLADVLSGANPDARYRGSKVATKLKVLGVEVASMGDITPLPEDEVVTYAEPHRGRYKKLIIRGGRLAGAILLGDSAKAAALVQSFDRQSALPEDRATLLFDIGKTKASPMLEMPDNAIVCNCNGINKGAIRHAAESGNCDFKFVCQKTRAGSGCGSCKPLIREIVNWVNDSKA